MNGYLGVLELQLIEANETVQDLHEQLKNKWLMGKDRLIIEHEYFVALAHFDDVVEQEANCTFIRTYH